MIVSRGSRPIFRLYTYPINPPMNRRLPAAVSLALGLGASMLTAAVPTPLAAQSDAPITSLVVAAADRGSDPEASLSDLVTLNQRTFGRSGALRVAVVRALDVVDLPFVRRDDTADGVVYRWMPLFGTPPESVGGDMRLAGHLRAPTQPGIWRLLLRRGEEQHEVRDFTIVTQVAFTEKRSGRLNGYNIGTYPTEGTGRMDRYAPPAGFIEVTPGNRDMQVSKHFRLGQFLTKDQFNVWPKYVALDLQLIDKLELVMQELNAMGVRAERMHVMSGYRTPQYNGPGDGGRAQLSRHMYGDAADVWVENGTRTGAMADLNGDGQIDERDALVLLQAVDRVEQKHPDLVGGAGVYRAYGARGPFVHIDVRGAWSRW